MITHFFLPLRSDSHILLRSDQSEWKLYPKNGHIQGGRGGCFSWRMQRGSHGSPVLEGSRSWVAVYETYTSRSRWHQLCIASPPAGRNPTGEQEGVGGWEKVSSFTSGGARKEEENSPFVKSCCSLTQPAFLGASVLAAKAWPFSKVSLLCENHKSLSLDLSPGPHSSVVKMPRSLLS